MPPSKNIVTEIIDIGDDTTANQRRLRIGTGNDLALYHYASNSHIENLTGNLIIENTQNDGKVQIKLGTTTANTDFEIVKSDGTPVFNVDGAGGVSIPGSLTTGTHVDNTQIKDLIIELGNGRTGDPSDDAPAQNPTGDCGIVMIRGDTGFNNAFMGFDDSEDKFIMGTGEFTGASSGDLTITPGTLQVAGIEGPSALTLTSTSGTMTLNGTGRLIDVNCTDIDIDATNDISLDAGAASNFTTTAGALTLDGASGVNIQGNASEIDITTSGALDLNSGVFTLNCSTSTITSTDTTSLSMAANSAAAKTLTIDASNSGAGIASINIGTTSGTAISIGHTTSETTVNDDLTVTGTLDVTGDTSVSTFDSSGATSLATGGGVVNIASTGVMTTVKGTLNVDEAVTLDTTLDVTGTVTANGGIESKNGASGSGFIDLYEDSDNDGTNKIRIIAPAAVTSNITLTLPDGAGSADQVLTTNGSGVLSWATASSNIDELTDGKSGGANFTNSMILGHETTGTLDAAERNTAVGIASMDAITSGDDNVCVGHDAGGLIDSGSKNTCIGSSAGDALTTGSNNTIIGYDAAASAVGANNEITLGDGNIDTIRSGATTIASLSDRRDKTNIVNSNYGLNFIEKLRPVEFTWKRRILNKSDENNSHNGKNRLGFIAQELQEAMPNKENDILDLVYESNPERLEVKQGNLVPILVKAIQELQAQVKTLQTAFDAIKN